MLLHRIVMIYSLTLVYKALVTMLGKLESILKMKMEP